MKIWNFSNSPNNKYTIIFCIFLNACVHFHPGTVTDLQLHVCLQYVWPTSLHHQPKFTFWNITVRHVAKFTLSVCCQHTLSVGAICIPPLCVCSPETSPTLFCLVKEMFLSETLGGKHGSLYRKLLDLPWDDYCLKRLEGFDLLTEKLIPSRTECRENTLAANPTCQPIIWQLWHPAENQCGKKTKSFTCFFPVRGEKILLTISQKAFSPPFSPEVEDLEDGF